MNTNEIKKELFAMQDKEYKAFHSRLMPTINPDTIIGVRIPLLRSFAKKLNKEADNTIFLKALPHQYYEENNLHAFLIEQISDFDLCICELNRFLPYVDNWATCDCMRPKSFKRNKEKLICYVYNWLKSNNTYTVRYAIEMLMLYFLDEDFKTEYSDTVSEIKSDEYYVNMMIAWYFATALSKQWDRIIPYIENYRLPQWVHNKTIQKAVESYRITKEQKEYLKKFRIK